MTAGDLSFLTQYQRFFAFSDSLLNDLIYRGSHYYIIIYIMLCHFTIASSSTWEQRSERMLREMIQNFHAPHEYILVWRMKVLKHLTQYTFESRSLRFYLIKEIRIYLPRSTHPIWMGAWWQLCKSHRYLCVCLMTVMLEWGISCETGPQPWK